MAKAKKRARKTIKIWSAQDMKQLKQMLRARVPTKTIARKLGRTIGALYQRASTEGISLKH